MDDNIKVDLIERGCNDKRWVEVVQDRVIWRILCGVCGAHAPTKTAFL